MIDPVDQDNFTTGLMLISAATEMLASYVEAESVLHDPDGGLTVEEMSQRAHQMAGHLVLACAGLHQCVHALGSDAGFTFPDRP